MKKVTLIPGPSWIEYLLTLKMSPFILRKLIEINGNKWEESENTNPEISIWKTDQKL